MTVIALASAKGSPGVSVGALALATCWPHEVAVADVDPAGGDLLWRTRDTSGRPLDRDRGLLTLAAAARRGAADTSLDEHLQDTSLGVPLLAGVSSPEQLTGLGSVWSQLPGVFGAHRTDVIVDCGRIVPGSAAMPVLLGADVVVFVVRPDVEGIAHLRDRLQALSGALRFGYSDGVPVGIAVATTYRDTRTVDDLERLLQSESLPVPVLGIVADDPKAARILSATRLGDPRRTLLGRSARTLAEQIGSLPATRRALGVI